MKFTVSKSGLIRPANEEDLPLFRHCSGDLYAVNQVLFDTEVKGLLAMHGIIESEMSFTKEDGE